MTKGKVTMTLDGTDKKGLTKRTIKLTLDGTDKVEGYSDTGWY